MLAGTRQLCFIGASQLLWPNQQYSFNMLLFYFLFFIIPRIQRKLDFADCLRREQSRQLLRLETSISRDIVIICQLRLKNLVSAKF